MSGGVLFEKEENRKGFTGYWIPREILQVNEISASEKFLWAEIHALSWGGFDAGQKGCFKSNEGFARDLGLSVKQIERMLSNLRKAGLIKTTNFDGRSRYMESIVPKGGDQNPPQIQGESTRKYAGSRPANTRGINNSINNSLKNMSSGADDAVFDAIWKARKSGFRRDTNRGKALLHFRARIRDGVSAEDLKKSIENYWKQCALERRQETSIKQVQFFFSDKWLVEGNLAAWEPERTQPNVSQCPSCGKVVSLVNGGETICQCGLKAKYFGETPERRALIRKMEGTA